MLDPATISAGDLLFRWHDTGCFGNQVYPLKVIRVNRVTVTVEDEYRNVGRIKFANIDGRLSPSYEWEYRC